MPLRDVPAARTVVLSLVVLAAAGALVVGGASAAAGPRASFEVFSTTTGHGMDGIVWTGTVFLYVENTANTVWSAPPTGSPLQVSASMPALVEETRCVLSPGTHGFPTGAVFCHS